MRNKVLIINHVFWPDQHNTARHISELSFELVLRGWDVTALLSNRSYVNKREIFKPKKGIYKGVKYIRVYTPSLNQKKNFQRLFTSFWLVLAWIIKLPFIGKFDAIIIGTNPPFGYFILPFLRIIKPNAKLLMWGFDLYPEAIMASGGHLWKFFGSLIFPITKFCYSFLKVIVDIGPCMKQRYKKYKSSALNVTLPPWSFIEPEDIVEPHKETRKELFGDAKLTLLYSGTIGNAHEFDNFLLLARELRKRKVSVAFCFAGFGNGFNKLKGSINKDDTNIGFGGFVKTDDELEKRLSSPDIMLISLKDEWTGISVPSKFFGAIANGKAVLFSGSKESSISTWASKYSLGFHLSNENINEIADTLVKVSNNPNEISEIKRNAFKAYRKLFSKKVVCDGWSKLLKEQINIS